MAKVKKKKKKRAVVKKVKSTNKLEGRRSDGRFSKGNQHGKGNVGASTSLRRELQLAFLKAFTPTDMKLVTKAIVKKAKAGNIAAAKLLLERGLGQLAPPVDESSLGEGPKVIKFPIMPK